MNWKRALIGIAVAIPIIALLAFGLGTVPGTEGLDPRDGKQANPFSLVTLDGGDTVRLADYSGQVVVVNFWGPWCVYCRLEHSDLSAAARLYESRGIHFFGVLFKDTPANGVDWIAEMGGQVYPAIWDRDLRVSIDYGVTGAPETFIIGRDSRIVHHLRGPVTLALLQSLLDPLVMPAAGTIPATDGAGASSGGP